MEAPASPDPARTPRWLLPVLLVAAVGAWLLSPDAWPAGSARVAVSASEGEPVYTHVVELGAHGSRPKITRAATGGPRLKLEHAEDRGGVLTARIAPGGAAAPKLGSWRVDLLLADGRRAALPAVEVDGDALVFRRHVPRRAPALLALLAVVIVLWLTEAVPLWVTGLLIPCVLVTTRVASATEALAPFFHPIIALFFGGFLLAEAMKRCGLGHRVAVWLIARVGRSPRQLYWALIGLSAFLSMWMSNTAAAALLIPVAIAVTEPLASLAYRKTVVLGIAFAATLGGVGSAIGTPANPLAMEFLGRHVGTHLSFVEWFAVGLPLVVVMLPAIGAWLWWRMRAGAEALDFAQARAVARSELARLGRLSVAEWQVLVSFSGIVVLWLTESMHQIATGIVALIGVIVLAALRRVKTEDLGNISWTALLTFGGGLTLGVFMTETGVSDWVATHLTFLEGVPDFVAVGVVAGLALGLTAVASNTASAAMLIPLSIPLARLVGVDPTVMVLVVALASSIDFAVVIGTPPTMMAYATGLYSTREIFRLGFVLDLLGLVALVTAVVGLWHLLGVV